MAGHDKSMRQQERAAARRRERTRERQARRESRGAPTLDEAEAPMSGEVFEDDAQELAQAPLRDLVQASSIYLTMIHAGVALWIMTDTVTTATAAVPLGLALSVTTGWSLVLLRHAIREHAVTPRAGVPALKTHSTLRIKAGVGGAASLLASMLWLWLTLAA